jgi:hypothetical protein
MTAAGRYAPLFEGLPSDIAGLADIVQGLLLHESWAPAYGSMLSDEQHNEKQLRRTEHIWRVCSQRTSGL